MTKTEALNFFNGASNLARLLTITPHAIYQWPELVPEKMQWKIALLSSFSLMPDDDLFPKGVKPESLKKGTVIADERVGKLLTAANELAQKGKGDILNALLTMANHNL